MCVVLDKTLVVYYIQGVSRQPLAKNRAFIKKLQTAFGKKLKAQRRTSNAPKQEVLADALDVTRTTISNIENGKHRVFLDQVYLAAEALGVPVTSLLPEIDAIRTSVAERVSFADDADVNPEDVKWAYEVAERVVKDGSRTKRAKTKILSRKKNGH